MTQVKCDECGTAFELKLREEIQKDGLDRAESWGECPNCRKAYSMSNMEAEILKFKERQRAIAEELEEKGEYEGGGEKLGLEEEYAQNLERMREKAGEAGAEAGDYMK